MKNILIDTQILIWISEELPKMKKSWFNLIEDSNNNVYISIVSFWEIAIKMSINKLKTEAELQQLFDFVEDANIKILPIHPENIQLVKDLPFHHKDPFDRMIIAQAISNNYEVISSDEKFGKYKISLL
jgi:PIN domain nuclease of toxin-antitoxin system